MRFLIDAQLPPALARCIDSTGHVATHVSEHALTEASDATIWDFATASGSVIVTKDADFAARKIRAAEGPPVIWLRWPNMRRRDLVGRFKLALPSVIEALENGETLIETV